VKIVDILNEEMIIPELGAVDKDSLISEIASTMCKQPALGCSADVVQRALLGRERLGSTGVGESVAIPHAKIPGLKSLTACFGRRVAGVAFDAVDQQPVRLVFVLLVPENSAGAHLKALARIARLLKSPSFRDRLLSLPDAHSIYEAFIEEDAKY
jgi:nitrogen PTS system EIIA component